MGSEYRAAGNLRSALWRLTRAELPLLTADKCYMALAPNLRVDAHLVAEWAARVISGRASEADLSFQPSGKGRCTGPAARLVRGLGAARA